MIYKMPVKKGSDNKGHYYQYGTSGKKYYYKTARGEKVSIGKARKQGIAIEISKKKKL